jgi:radical SAM protein
VSASIAAPFSKMDFDNSPYLVLWELTRACALACQHCRARALKRRNPHELCGNDISLVLDQLEEFGKPLIVLTGGDPFERPDLFDIIRECKRRNFKVAITPSATPKVGEAEVARLAEAGIERLAISLDGHTTEIHDAFRRVKGSFKQTIEIITWARAANIPVQINTSICKYNFAYFDNLSFMVNELGAVLWSLFFIVPTGRANIEMQISSTQAEEILKKMASLSVTSQFDIKATAAPQFRRVLLDTVFTEEHSHDLASISPGMRLGALRSYQSVNDGKGILFISHTGDVYPSGFLPISAGNLKEQSLAQIYRESEVFKNLRDASLLKGKCAACRYKKICGGSRARAFAETGDYLAEDSLCVYQHSLT